MASCMMRSRLQAHTFTCSISSRPCSGLRPRVSAARPITSTPRLPTSPYAPQQASQRRVVCQGLFGLGLPEVVVIVGVTALIFGPSKLPELGKGLGKTVKSFQTAAKEFETELKAAAADDSETPAAPTEAKKEEAPKQQ